MRRVASSRIRCATVIASVFAITKPPTNSAMPPNPSRRYFKASVPAWSSLLSELAWAAALFTCVAERSGRIWRATRHPTRRLGLNANQVELACLSNRRWAVRRSKTVIVALPIESIEPKRTMPPIRIPANRTVPERAHRFPDLEVLLLRGRLVDRDLPVAARP